MPHIVTIASGPGSHRLQPRRDRRDRRSAAASRDGDRRARARVPARERARLVQLRAHQGAREHPARRQRDVARSLRRRARRRACSCCTATATCSSARSRRARASRSSRDRCSTRTRASRSQAEAIKLSTRHLRRHVDVPRAPHGPRSRRHPVDVPPPRERGVSAHVRRDGASGLSVLRHAPRPWGRARPRALLRRAARRRASDVSASGWIELPAARDMARIQCGRSSVQIEGTMVPVADFALAQGDGVYFPHHELLWKEPDGRVTQRGLKGAWKRMHGGACPCTCSTPSGPGRIAFSRDAAGETLAIPIAPRRVGRRARAPVHGGDARGRLRLVRLRRLVPDRHGRRDARRTTRSACSWIASRRPREPGLLLIHAHGNAFHAPARARASASS